MLARVSSNYLKQPHRECHVLAVCMHGYDMSSQINTFILVSIDPPPSMSMIHLVSSYVHNEKETACLVPFVLNN